MMSKSLYRGGPLRDVVHRLVQMLRLVIERVGLVPLHLLDHPFGVLDADLDDSSIMVGVVR